MKKCNSCKHCVELSINRFICQESLYLKAKYDNHKKVILNTFLPVVTQDFSCIKYSKKEAGLDHN